MRRAPAHDPRVGGEDAVHVGVDLAHVGAERGGQRHRGGVRPAPPERRDVLGVLGHALEAGHDRDRAVVEGAAGSGPGVTSMMRALPCAESVITPACDPVNDRPSRPRFAIAMASSAIEIRSPAVSSMSSSRPGGSGLTWLARSRSSSVVSPMAETTTTTESPALRVATMRCATRLMPSASATEDPPYFCTMSATVAPLLPLGWSGAHECIQPAGDARCSFSAAGGFSAAGAPGRAVSRSLAPRPRPAGRARPPSAAPAWPRWRACPSGSRRSTATTTAPRPCSPPGSA